MYKPELILLIFQMLLIKASSSQDNPDSVIYIVDKWGATTITTFSAQQREKYVVPKPSGTSTPFNLEVNNTCVIHMCILDTNNAILKKYEFPVSTPGTYSIKWWAFYDNLPPGTYKYDYKWLDKYEEHKIIKLE